LRSFDSLQRTEAYASAHGNFARLAFEFFEQPAIRVLHQRSLRIDEGGLK
jgi:hypothetical protein